MAFTVEHCEKVLKLEQHLNSLRELIRLKKCPKEVKRTIKEIAIPMLLEEQQKLLMLHA
jgi:hypothetical protein